MLVRIEKDWDFPDILRQTPGSKGAWDGIQFTLDPVKTCDFFIMFNNRMTEDTVVSCHPENVWALMQEPFEKGLTDWMVEKHDEYRLVLTHVPPDHSRRYRVSHPAIPWHVNRTYDELSGMTIPEKSKDLSWVVGNARDLPGHLKRWSFLDAMQNQNTLKIDLFGRAVHPIEDKFDGLAPYRYSLAVENSVGPDYWTEKIADCFLTWTVPFYYGCSNLEDYFPAESFIRIDIDPVEKGIQTIREVMEGDRWERRIPALTKARRLVLERYQIFPHLAGYIKSHPPPDSDKQTIRIPAYRRGLKSGYHRIGYKLRKRFGRL